jgi:molecular chaperone IbpA
MHVVGAKLADGLLSIELKREVPEALQPRRINIDSERSSHESVKQLLDQAAA